MIIKERKPKKNDSTTDVPPAQPTEPIGDKDSITKVPLVNVSPTDVIEQPSPQSPDSDPPKDSDNEKPIENTSLSLDEKLKEQFTQVGTKSDGMIAVSNGQKWGYTDAKGNLVIQPTFEKANSFSQGFACVQVNWPGKNGKWIFINKQGKNAFGEDMIFDQGATFKGGKAEVIKGGENYILDIQGILEAVN